MTAALISIALGVWPVLRAHPSPSWPWCTALRPLDRAPIAAGTRLVLLPPPGTSGSDSQFWVYEARWRRPDLFWSLLREWPSAQPPTLGVAVGLEAPPDGWHQVWRRGDLVVAARDDAR